MYCCEKYNSLTGEVILPTDYRYEKARQEWNRAIQKYPIAIVYCKNKYEVRNALCWAIRHKLGFRIRSGGHNYEGYSTGNNILVIDISRMDKILIDEERNFVKIQGGVINRKLYDTVASRGYPFPGGTCPTVGVAGYTQGGGWGLSCRLFGLGADNLLEFEMIDYKGRILIANENQNEDLFWACRGAGGGNFGIIVSMKFKLPKKVDKVTLFSIYYPDTSVDKQAEIMNVWQKMFQNLDNRVNMRGSFYNSINEGIAVYLTGLFYGNEEELKDILKPLADISGSNLTMEYITFLEAITKIQDGYPPYEKFKSTGRFVNRIYSRNQLINISKLIQARPEGSVFTAITFYGLGGAVSDVKSDETAFYYRDSNYIMGIQSVWVDSIYQDINTKWVEEKFNYIKKITQGSFVNFPYSELKDYEKEYYGENRWKLKLVKRIYDPCNIFKFPQSIR